MPLHTAVGLSHYGRQSSIDTSGTESFVTLFSRLWKILDNRGKFRHLRLRDPDRQPITSLDDESVTFIKYMYVIDWLQNWKCLNQKPRSGCLSRETISAISHSLKTILILCKYLLSEKNDDFVLPGKLQTDPLKARFSRYRSMSGAKFHVSIHNILNSEKKLKVH